MSGLSAVLKAAVPQLPARPRSRSRWSRHRLLRNRHPRRSHRLLCRRASRRRSRRLSLTPAGAPIAPLSGTVPDLRFQADPAPSPVIAPIAFSAPEPPTPVAANPAPAARAPANGNAAANDALLEQPLHMTLEQLRQMIRR